MDGITQDTVPVEGIDSQGLLNGDASDEAKKEIMDEDCVDPPHTHIEQAEEEKKEPEQDDVVMNSIPEQKVRCERKFCRILQRSAPMLSVCVSVSVLMESAVTLTHSYLTPQCAIPSARFTC